MYHSFNLSKYILIIISLIFVTEARTQNDTLFFPLNFIIVNPTENSFINDFTEIDYIAKLNDVFNPIKIVFPEDNYQTFTINAYDVIPLGVPFSYEKLNEITDYHFDVNKDRAENYINIFILDRHYFNGPPLARFGLGLINWFRGNDTQGLGYLPIDAQLDYFGEVKWQRTNNLFLVDDSIIEALIHEMGHIFGLLHTFHDVNNSIECGRLEALSKNQFFNGDFIDDTDVVPNIKQFHDKSYCGFEQVWQQNDMVWKNFMNYGLLDGIIPNSFTLGQKNKMFEYANSPDRIRLTEECSRKKSILFKQLITNSINIEFLGSIGVLNCFKNKKSSLSNFEYWNKSQTVSYNIQITKNLMNNFTLTSGYKDNWLDPVDNEVVVDFKGVSGGDGKVKFSWDSSLSDVYEEPIIGEQYKVTLALYNDAETAFSAFSDEFIFTYGDYQCSGTSGLSHGDIRADGAHLSWNPGSNIDYYKVHWGVNGASDDYAITTSNSFSLADRLSQDQNYCWYIESYCKGGSIITSDQRCFKTSTGYSRPNNKRDLEIDIRNGDLAVAFGKKIRFELMGKHSYENPSNNYDDVYPDVHLYLSTSSSFNDVIQDLGVVPFQLSRISSINEEWDKFTYTMSMERALNVTTTGTYYLLAEIDKYDAYDEAIENGAPGSGEGNNTDSFKFKVVQDIEGCTSPSSHNYNYGATIDDGTCETCFDHIKNGNERGRDCGGSCRQCADCPDITDIEYTVTNQELIPTWQDSEERYYSILVRRQGSTDYFRQSTSLQYDTIYGLEPETDYLFKIRTHCFDIDVDSPEYFFTTGAHVDGCNDPNAHNYNDQVTRKDESCETCYDRIQNGDETGMDCGGSNCIPCYCQNDHEEVNVNIYSDKNVQANKTVIGSADVFYGTTEFQAGKAVVLRPGFEAKNTTFKAHIDECSDVDHINLSKHIFRPNEPVEFFFNNISGGTLTWGAEGVGGTQSHGRILTSFEYPGIYDIVYSRRTFQGTDIVESKQIVVESCDWRVYATDNFGRLGVDVDVCNLIDGGITKFDPQIPYTIDGDAYFPKFLLYRDFDISADEYKLTARVRSLTNNELSVIAYGSENNTSVKLKSVKSPFQSGHSSSYLSPREQYANIDKSTWVELGFELHGDNTLSFFPSFPNYLNKYTYLGSNGDLLGIGISSRDGIEVDWIRLEDKDGNVVFEEDFDHCNSYCD